MSLSKKEREKLEQMKKDIEELLKKDETPVKEQDWVDYGSRERREW
jgi:hypothetical protein